MFALGIATHWSRVLQRNRGVCVYMCVYIYERDYKDLGHMIMETEKSQDLHLARGTQESQRCSSILRPKF